MRWITPWTTEPCPPRAEVARVHGGSADAWAVHVRQEPALPKLPEDAGNRVPAVAAVPVVVVASPRDDSPSPEPFRVKAMRLFGQFELERRGFLGAHPRPPRGMRPAPGHRPRHVARP